MIQFNPKFNTDYLPEIDEDAIETHPPSQYERWGFGIRMKDIDAVIKEDRARFRAICKKYGFNSKDIL